MFTGSQEHYTAGFSVDETGGGLRPAKGYYLVARGYGATSCRGNRGDASVIYVPARLPMTVS